MAPSHHEGVAIGRDGIDDAVATGKHLPECLACWGNNGKMDPPQTFVANPAPPPLAFKKRAYAIPPVAIRAAGIARVG